jgi:hypothetical protein
LRKCLFSYSTMGFVHPVFMRVMSFQGFLKLGSAFFMLTKVCAVSLWLPAGGKVNRRDLVVKQDLGLIFVICSYYRECFLFCFIQIQICLIKSIQIKIYGFVRIYSSCETTSEIMLRCEQVSWSLFM